MHAPVQVEPEDCDPGEGADEDEVAVVADDGTDVVLGELADGGGGGASKVETARLGEVGEEEEAAKKGGEGDIDEDDLALEVLVAGEEPVDDEGENQAEQADHGADGEEDQGDVRALLELLVAILWLGHHNLRSSLCALDPKVVNTERGGEAPVDNAEESVSLNLVLASVVIADFNIPDCFEEKGKRGNVQIWSHAGFIVLRIPYVGTISLFTNRLA